jgi:hypothetical protein
VRKSKIIMVGLTLGACLFVLAANELRLRFKHYHPGWIIPYFKTVKTIDTTTQRLRVDDFGINTYIPGQEDWGGAKINKQGFVSDFDYDSITICRLRIHRKLVFIIGTSFTEGCCPIDGMPRSATYFQLLSNDTALNSHYLFCNFGVAAQDAFNYQLIAEKYAAALKPDIIIINYCFNNDIYTFINRTTIPNFIQPCFTETGKYISTSLPDKKRHFTSHKAVYDFYYNLYNIGALGFGGRLCSFSNTTTRLYQALQHIEPFRFPPVEVDSSVCSSVDCLNEIEEVCEQNKVELKITYIPSIFETYPEFLNHFQRTFRYLKGNVLYPTNITYKDYISEENEHFNRDGNYKYYEFLKGVLNAAK